MNLYQPTITGSLSVSGSVNISGSITIAGGGTISGTASIATTALTASSADNLLVRNTLTAQTLVVQTITSSVDFVTGSTRFGSIAANTHVFTGSMSVSGSGTFTGNIGIGLTNPGVALDISGYSRVTGVGLNSTPTSIGANPNYVRLTNTGGDLYLGQEGSTNGGFFVGSLAYDSVLYSGRSINSIINGVSRMYINSSGSVGIGNTNPTYRLDIFSGSDFDIRLRDTSLGGTVGILFETANDFSGTSQSYIKGIGAGNSGISQLIFGTAGAVGDTTATEKVRITSGGVLKIGNSGTADDGSNPGYKNVAIAFNSSQNRGEIQAVQQGLSTYPLIINGAGGNVGIGHYIPDQILDIRKASGDAYINISRASQSTGQVALRLSGGTGGTNWVMYQDTNANHLQFYGNDAERFRITSGGTVFYKGYFGSTLLGGFSVIGTLSAINTADRYLHARINTIGTMMYWIKVFGYVYTTTIIEGLSGGYLGGGTGGVQQAFQNGSIVAQYQNDGYLEVVVDTLNTNTTNRWGSITFLGGSDTLTTVQPLEIMAYSWTSTVTRVY
jgi:hypothetical protein